ncbi:MAG TPA: hypothetical protein VLW50_19090 [Streptosporangiaceae bacterium]|nr:hypothetical protein [Streptosporangiaceae bacterium]
MDSKHPPGADSKVQVDDLEEGCALVRIRRRDGDRVPCVGRFGLWPARNLEQAVTYEDFAIRASPGQTRHPRTRPVKKKERS